MSERQMMIARDLGGSLSAGVNPTPDRAIDVARTGFVAWTMTYSVGVSWYLDILEIPIHR
ncbi:hypothetical protein BH23ACT4_BH23ACT4_06300 [soil metagenome]